MFKLFRQLIQHYKSAKLHGEITRGIQQRGRTQ